MLQPASIPLTEARVREVLATLAGRNGDAIARQNGTLVRDYLRIMEIHGASSALSEVMARVGDSASAVDVARIAALRAQVCGAAQVSHAGFDAVDPREEAAVLACSAEIDATLRRLSA